MRTAMTHRRRGEQGDTESTQILHEWLRQSRHAQEIPGSVSTGYMKTGPGVPDLKAYVNGSVRLFEEVMGIAEALESGIEMMQRGRALDGVFERHEAAHLVVLVTCAKVCACVSSHMYV